MVVLIPENLKIANGRGNGFLINRTDLLEEKVQFRVSSFIDYQALHSSLKQEVP